MTLETKVLGYKPAKNDYLFERRLNDRLMEVVTTHYDGKPALVFCGSRNGAADAAKELATKASTFRSHPFVRDHAAPKSTRRSGIARELQGARADDPARGRIPH